MGRPKVPLIDRHDAIAKALEIIDREGADALSIRRLGTELGVNGASLYHHFKDKEDIVQGVRRLVLKEARVMVADSKKLTWQEYASRSVTRFRSALLSHPNMAPLMLPGVARPMAVHGRDQLITKMTDAGVPLRLTYPIIDSIETFAFGSAIMNPGQMRPSERFAVGPEYDVPNLRRALKMTSMSAERLFRFELEALLKGWVAMIEEET